MEREYTLEEIYDLVYSNSVDASNLNDILNSLLSYDLDEKVRDIFDKLADNAELPKSIRDNLQRVVEAYDTIVEAKAKEEVAPVQEATVAVNGDENNSLTDTSKSEEQSQDASTKEVTEQEPVVEPKEPEVVLEPVENDVSFEPVEVTEDFYQDPSVISGAYETNNDIILASTTAYALSRGLNVMSQNPGIQHYPEFSIELTAESKPYIDNLLLNLNKNKNDINVELSRIESTGKEVLTLKVDNPELSQAQLQEKGYQMFTEIEKIMKETNEEKDYEANMPPALKNLKDKFVNDDPNIPDADFKVGFSNSDGKSSYYLIANNEKQALAISEEMGYEIKEDRGGGVFEIDTDDKKMEGTKLDKVTLDINTIDEVKDESKGISDVDINYNNKNFDNGEENYSRITSFIEDNRDPSTMSIVQVDVPGNNPNQRIVSLASSDGTRETVVFNDGDAFDNNLPKIADVYGKGENTSIDSGNVVKVDYNNGTSSYETLSSDNTYLRLNNLSKETVDSVNNSISQYVATEENVNTNVNVNQKNNNYVKTIGTYPTNTNYKESANTSFLTLLVFTLITILGILIVYVLYGG